MRLPYFIADAFANKPFSGNPAAVVPLDHWIPEEEMQAIAEQHNLSETAFVVVHPDENGCRPLRWFTPAKEVRLCGHATLATAFVLGSVLRFRDTEFSFSTLSGKLICTQTELGWSLDFPADIAQPAPHLREACVQILGDPTLHFEVFEGQDDAMLVLAEASTVRDYQPNDRAIRSLPKRGVILTAPGDGGYDVVSRCFYPEFGVDEDAVTGSAHTLLGPFWAKRLNLENLKCWQASRRGGQVLVTYAQSERVQLTGQARLFAQGELETGL